MSELRRSVIWEVEFYPTARTTDIGALDPAKFATADWTLTDNYDPDFGDREHATLDPDREEYRYQRKWVALLTEEQWRSFADGLCIDLDGSGNPEDGEICLGQLTGCGLIPDTYAITIDPMDWNQSGGPTPVWGADLNVSLPLEFEDRS